MGGRIGVLALQGDVSEHISAFREAMRIEGRTAERSVVPVHDKETLATCDGLVIPGGESTTVSWLIERNDLHRAICEFDGAIFATCAGMVLLGTDVRDTRIRPLGLIDMRIERNAFGRQRESFEAKIDVRGLDNPFHAVFIRAPVATAVGKGVETLAVIPEGIVGVRKDRHLAFSFHPELGSDRRLHSLFLKQLEIA